MVNIEATGGEAFRRLTTVVAADICGYSRLAEADESAAVRTVNAVHAVFEQCVTSRRGRIFHRAGDGFLAEFPSAADAVLAALEFVADIRRRDTLAPNGLPAKVRAGVHVGDVLERRDGDLLGHGVNVAARLQAEAEPGGVLVSLHTVNIVRGKVEATFRRRGPLALKNIDEPVVAFDVEAGSGAHWSSRLGLRVRRLSTKSGALLGIATIAALVAVLAFFGGASSGLRNPVGADANLAVSPATRAEKMTNIVREAQSAPPDTGLIIAISDAMSSLADSPVPEKVTAATLIEKGDIAAAIEELKAVLARQTSRGVNTGARVETMKEIGALSFFSSAPEALSIYEALRELAPDDPVVWNQLGTLRLKQGATETARTAFMKLADIAGSDRFWLLKSKIGVGRSYLWDDAPARAKTDIREALDVARAIASPQDEAECLSLLATAEKKLERHEAAEDYQRAAILIYDRQKDLYGRSRGRWNLGNILTVQGREDEAVDVYREAIEISKQANDPRSVASAKYNLSIIEIERGELSSAETLLTSAADIAQQEGMRGLEIYSIWQLGVVSYRKGEMQAACAYLDRALGAIRSGAKVSEENLILINDDAAQFRCAV